MKVYTLKNMINTIKNFKKNRSYIFNFKGSDGDFVSFELEGQTLSMSINKENKKIIDDIYLTRLPSKSYKSIEYIERTYKKSGDLLRETKLYPDFEAQLFIEVFKILKERVNFTFSVDNVFYDAYYVDGKLLYIEETASEVRLRGSNLYQIQSTHPGYKIEYISNIFTRPNYTGYIQSIEKYAFAQDKNFKKFVYGSI